MLRSLLTLLFLLQTQTALGVETFNFKHPQDKQRFTELVEELRCPVCQNQSLADSNADLAEDLRHEIFKQIEAGKDDEAIIEFMVERYGDFIIYRPRLKPVNYLLWFGPLAFLLLGFYLLYHQLSKQKTSNQELTKEEQRQLDDILAEIDQEEKRQP